MENFGKLAFWIEKESILKVPPRRVQLLKRSDPGKKKPSICTGKLGN